MRLSSKGASFVASHEGFVSRTYLCPAGMRTIGYGFTMGSRVFSAYWQQKHGRGIQMGDTMSRAEADTLLPRVFDEEYGAAVNRQIAPRIQHHYDGAGSVTFNCGPGALAWQWAQMLKTGRIADAAHRLRSTAVTANGRRLAGLVRRRDEEATLIETGRYTGGSAASVSTGSSAIREYQQQLATLGYDVGPVDGIAGPRTLAAVRAFQTKKGLVVGIILIVKYRGAITGRRVPT